MRPPVWIGHVELKTAQLAKAEEFYRSIGLRSVFKGDDIAIFELRGGTHLLLIKDDDFAGGDAGIDFMVEDIDETYAAYTAKGLPVSDISRGNIHDSFYLTDPGGNRIVVNSTHVDDHSVV